MHSLRPLNTALVVAILLAACAAPSAQPAERSGAAPPAAPTTARAAAPPGGSAAPAPAAVAPLSPPVTVRIGVLQTLALAPFAIAETRGYYAEEGLQLEYANFDSGARMVAPMAAGQLDVAQGSHSAGLFNALASGIDLKIVSDNGVLIPGRNTSQIVARKALADQ